MNWRRIAIFVVVQFAATFAAALPVGFVQGVYRARGIAPPDWLVFVQAAGAFAANVIVIVFLAKRQRDRTWLTASAVVLVAWALAFPLSVGLLGQSPSGWAKTIVPLCIALAIGVPIGRRFRDGS
jgi:hypothetical protein